MQPRLLPHTHLFFLSGLGLQSLCPTSLVTEWDQLPAPVDCYNKMFTVWKLPAPRGRSGAAMGLFSPSSRWLMGFEGLEKPLEKMGQ